MYKQELNHKLKLEVLNDLPKYTIGIKFNDYFTNDTYFLISETTKNYNPKRIPFSFVVNNERKGVFYLNEMKGIEFLNEVFSGIIDYDFQSFLTDRVKNSISTELLEAISYYEKQIILNEVTLNGELNRMKELSGMKKKFA